MDIDMNIYNTSCSHLHQNYPKKWQRSKIGAQNVAVGNNNNTWFNQFKSDASWNCIGGISCRTGE